MSAAPYTCAECKAPVVVLPNGDRIRVCTHHTAAVHLHMTATVSADGGVTVQHIDATRGVAS